LSKQSKPANPSDLLTHPAVVHAIRRASKRLIRSRLFHRIPRADIVGDLRLEVAIRLQDYKDDESCINTFATVIARNAAISMLRARAARSRRGDCATVSVECVIARSQAADATLSNAFARATGRQQRDFTERISHEDSVAELMRLLSPRLAEAAVAMCTCTRHGACQRLGISQRQMRHLAAQLRSICESQGIFL